MTEGFTLADLMRETFLPRREIVSGTITEGVTLLAGKAKIGKSWLVNGLALSVARGEMALGEYPVVQGRVVLISLEDGVRRLQERFGKLLGDEAPPENLVIHTTWAPLNDGGVEQLDTELTAHPETTLVVIDTLAKARGTTQRSIAREYALGDELKTVAERHHVAIVVVCHTGKERSSDDPVSDIIGTTGLGAGVDNMLVLRHSRGEGGATLWVTGRDIREERAVALAFDPETAQWTITGDAAAEQMSPERRAIVTLLEEADTPMGPTEIARALEKNASTVKTLVGRMVSAAEIITVGRGKYTAINHVDRVDRVDLESLDGEEQGDDAVDAVDAVDSNGDQQSVRFRHWWDEDDDEEGENAGVAISAPAVYAADAVDSNGDQQRVNNRLWFEDDEDEEPSLAAAYAPLPSVLVEPPIAPEDRTDANHDQYYEEDEEGEDAGVAISAPAAQATGSWYEDDDEEGENAGVTVSAPAAQATASRISASSWYEDDEEEENAGVTVSAPAAQATASWYEDDEEEGDIVTPSRSATMVGTR